MDTLTRAAPAAPTPSDFTTSTATELRRLAAWRALVPRRWWDIGLWSYPARTAPHFAQVVRWLDDPRARPGLLLHGAPGRGKTGLALGVLRELVAPARYAGAFCVVPDLLEALRQSYRGRDDDAPDPLEQMRRVPVLVLDDIGAERVTDWVQDRLYLLINTRHADPRLLTVFTSNLSPGALADHLGERIAWRILEMAAVVKVDGPNLRDGGRAA